MYRQLPSSADPRSGTVFENAFEHWKKQIYPCRANTYAQMFNVTCSKQGHYRLINRNWIFWAALITLSYLSFASILFVSRGHAASFCHVLM